MKSTIPNEITIYDKAKLVQFEDVVAEKGQHGGKQKASLTFNKERRRKRIRNENLKHDGKNSTRMVLKYKILYPQRMPMLARRQCPEENEDDNEDESREVAPQL